jgi:hypothetical protein
MERSSATLAREESTAAVRSTKSEAIWIARRRRGAIEKMA